MQSGDLVELRAMPLEVNVFYATINSNIMRALSGPKSIKIDPDAELVTEIPRLKELFKGSLPNLSECIFFFRKIKNLKKRTKFNP